MEVDAPVFMFLTIINLVLFILATTARGSTSDLTPAYLIQVNCVGVEKRLIDCPRDYPLSYYTCPNKVQVNCSDSDTGSPCMIRPCMYQLLLANNMYILHLHNYADANRECDNGQLRTNRTTNILYICVNGTWKTLCPRLWGPSQATVACRQLNPGRTVISEFLCNGICWC